ncbi:MAG TPA: peptidoglycan DD-metalloendopeptidase family protein [Nocardioides sp.]|nr:peptidoglycan DD-metalloendopeptidase family protein [Nocardioides sp.]
MRFPLRAATAVSLAVLAVLAAPGVATAAAPQNDYEMPFPCGQAWTGTTRSSHSPSSRAIDWNRPDDVDDPVVAAAPGTVSRAERGSSGYGNWVRVDHRDGESTIYAHLNSLTVAVGQTVDQGAQVGTLGSTGNSSGPHLHFEERNASGVLFPWFHGVAFSFGSTLVSQNCVDVPLAGNFLRGAKAEVAVFRRGPTPSFLVRRPRGGARTIAFGAASDQPVVGDWDGNGRTDVGVRTPATRTFQLRTPDGVVPVTFGAARDLPVAGDWDGDGRWEVGVRRAGSNVYWLRRADGSRQVLTLGDVDDLPVTGDWDGDGRTDIGAYDSASATFTLRIADGEGLVWTAQVPFGSPGDLPVTGDWDGNARTDVGAWSPVSGSFAQRRATRPTASRSTTSTITFGNPR